MGGDPFVIVAGNTQTNTNLIWLSIYPLVRVIGVFVELSI